jgi:RNA polymerase sigma factor (sigma-70 family)
VVAVRYASDEQIVGLLGYVRVIARRLYRSVGAVRTRAIELEDLEAEGYLALVRAAQNYDPSRGVPLRGYMRVQVVGHLRHVLRRSDPKGRANRRTIRAGNTWADRATHEFGRFPTWAEIEASVPGYRAAWAAAERRRPIPLDAVDRAAPLDVEDVVVRHLERADLWRLVEQLPRVPRAAITLHYRDDLEVRDVATALGLTQGATYVALRRAQLRLRDRAGES